LFALLFSAACDSTATVPQADTQTELNASVAVSSFKPPIAEASAAMPGPLGKIGVPRSDFVRLLIQARAFTVPRLNQSVVCDTCLCACTARRGNTTYRHEHAGTNARTIELYSPAFALQSLISLGYNESARSVETESGVVLQSDAVSQFRALILRGAWAEAHAMLAGGRRTPRTTPPPQTIEQNNTRVRTHMRAHCSAHSHNRQLCHCVVDGGASQLALGAAHAHDSAYG
jgi:hypothetical protein